jgi:hypothetical protein
MGLASLGPRVSRLLLIPNLPAYLAWLQPELCPSTQPNELKRLEANQVGAIEMRSNQMRSNQI